MEELTRIDFTDIDGRPGVIYGYTKKTCLEKIGDELSESDIYAVVVKTKEDGDYILDSTINYTINKKENDNIDWVGGLIIDLYKNDSFSERIYNGSINNVNVGFSKIIIDHDSLTANSYKLRFYSSSGGSTIEQPVYYKITNFNQDEVFDGGTIYEGDGWIHIKNNYYYYGTLSIIISSTLV